MLHEHGSGNPNGYSANADRIPFHPYYTFKDIFGVFIFFLILSVFVFYYPNVLGHPDNYIMANPMQTPASIKDLCDVLLLSGLPMSPSSKREVEEAIDSDEPIVSGSAQDPSIIR